MVTVEEVSQEHDYDIEKQTREFDPKLIIEREQASGVALGPFHRKYLIEKAPESARKMLLKAREHPELLGSFSKFGSPDDIIDIGGGFPNASLKTTNTTTTETNLWDPGVLFRIPAYTMVANKRWWFSFGGLMGTTATPTLVARARFGTDNSAPPTGTDMGIGPTVTMGTFTAQPFHGEGKIGIRDAGIAASLVQVAGSGFIACPAAAAATVTPHLVWGGALPTTVNGAIDQGIAVSLAWSASSASNTWTCQWLDRFSVG